MLSPGQVTKDGASAGIELGHVGLVGLGFKAEVRVAEALLRPDLRAIRFSPACCAL